MCYSRASFFHSKGGQLTQQLPKPPKLTTVVSLSCGMAAERFFSLMKTSGVTALIDIRLGRMYPRAFWANERDMEYLCRLHGVAYHVIDDLMPTAALRDELHKVLDDKANSRLDQAEAWTRYLEQVAKLLTERKFLAAGRPMHELIYGEHEKVALVCKCHHHRDCHRSVATSMIARFVEGVSVLELYDGKPPSRETPKVQLRDVAGVPRDDDKRIGRATKVTS